MLQKVILIYVNIVIDESSMITRGLKLCDAK